MIVYKNSITLLGIDPSTKTGLVVIRYLPHAQQVLYANEIRGAGADFARSMDLADQLAQVCQQYSPAFAVIEGYGYANTHTLALLVEIGTLFRLTLIQNQIPYTEVPPASLKKFLAKGNMKKDLVRLETFKQFGFQDDSDNVVDAYVLAMVGGALSGQYPITKRQHESLKSIQSVCQSPWWRPQVHNAA